MTEVAATRFRAFAVRTVLAGKYRSAWGLTARAGRVIGDNGAVRAELRDLLTANLSAAGAGEQDRVNLIGALGSLKDEEAVPMLREIVGWSQDPSKQEKELPTIEAAAVALGKIGSQAAVGDLALLLFGTLEHKADIRLWPAAANSLLAIPGKIEPEARAVFKAHAVVGAYANDWLWQDHMTFHGEILPGRVSAKPVIRLGKDAMKALPHAFDIAPAMHRELLTLMLICDCAAGEKFANVLLDRLRIDAISGLDHGTIVSLIAKAQLGKLKLA